MIVVNFENLIFDKGLYLKKGAKKILLKVRGHAGYYRDGVDPVCAGASAVIQVLLLSIAELTKAKSSLYTESGKLYCEIDINGLSELELSKVLLLLESMIIGLVKINNDYPDSIKLEFVS